MTRLLHLKQTVKTPKIRSIRLASHVAIGNTKPRP